MRDEHERARLSPGSPDLTAGRAGASGRRTDRRRRLRGADFGAWKTTGTAFGSGPSRGALLDVDHLVLTEDVRSVGYPDYDLTPEFRETKEHPMRNLKRFLAASALAANLAAGAAAQPALEPRLQPLPTDQMGPFVKLGDGSVLAVTSEATVVSNDDGKTWSGPRPLFKKEQNLKVSNERALLRTKDGTLVLVFMNIAEQKWKWDNIKNEPAIECKLPVWAARSLDDGKTWQDVQKIQDGYCGAIRDLIETKDGHLVVPVQRLLPKEARHATMPFVSTDGGRTWKETTLLDVGGRGHHDGSIEATVEQLKDGRLWLLLRTSRDALWEAFSSDGGVTWKDFRKSGIAASSSPAMLKRLASGRLVLLWNRLYPEGKTETARRGAPWSETAASYHREELSLALSEDEGKTWSAPVVIATLPGKWVSYPYLFERQPGELWITTMQGGLRAVLQEKDFLRK